MAWPIRLSALPRPRRGLLRHASSTSTRVPALSGTKFFRSSASEIPVSSGKNSWLSQVSR